MEKDETAKLTKVIGAAWLKGNTIEKHKYEINPDGGSLKLVKNAAIANFHNNHSKAMAWGSFIEYTQSVAGVGPNDYIMFDRELLMIFNQEIEDIYGKQFVFSEAKVADYHHMHNLWRMYTMFYRACNFWDINYFALPNKVFNFYVYDVLNDYSKGKLRLGIRNTTGKDDDNPERLAYIGEKGRDKMLAFFRLAEVMTKQGFLDFFREDNGKITEDVVLDMIIDGDTMWKFLRIRESPFNAFHNQMVRYEKLTGEGMNATRFQARLVHMMEKVTDEQIVDAHKAEFGSSEVFPPAE